MRRTATILVLLVTVGGVSEAHAQVPTIDATTLAQVANIVKTGTQTLNQITSTLNTLNSVKSAIGEIGAGNLSALPGFSGALGSTSPTNSLLGQLTPSISALQGFASAAGTLDSTIKSLGSSSTSTFGSLSSTQSLVQSIFYPSSVSTMKGHDALMSARAAAAEDASVGGYALGLATKQSGSQGLQTTAQLTSYVSAATTERGDIQANSMIALAQYQQGQQILSVLAQDLLVHSANSIAADSADVLPTTAATASTGVSSGGTQ